MELGLIWDSSLGTQKPRRERKINRQMNGNSELEWSGFGNLLLLLVVPDDGDEGGDEERKKKRGGGEERGKKRKERLEGGG